MSEDIEAKIRRLRELGKTGADAGAPPTAKPSASKKPPKRPRSVGSIRERERKKRILVGASIIIIILVVISVGVYAYLQSQEAAKLTHAKDQKIAEVNTYFRGTLVNSSVKCSAEPIQIRNNLLNEIKNAKSIDSLDQINVKASYNLAVEKYNACVEKQKQAEYEKQLNQTKQAKLKAIETAFQPLLSMPLPDSLKKQVVSSMNSLESQVMNAKTEEQVQSINPDTYLLSLWKNYYYYIIDSIPGQNVVMEKGNVKRIVTKAQAKSIIAGVFDYKEITQYTFSKVEYVDIALVLTRDRINGGFLSPGSQIMIFAKNGTKGQFQEIVNKGYVELVLLPTDAGKISLTESQSQSSSSSSSSSTQYNENHQNLYNPGGGEINTQKQSTDSYTNGESSSQSASASYSYAVDLGEVLKAAAAGKIQSPASVEQQLKAYGWNVVNLENQSGMLVLPPSSQFMVIIKVPSIFVPDILSYQQYLYIAKVSS